MDKDQKREIVVYVIVGVIVTIVDYGVYSVLVKFAGTNINVANIIAWIVAVAVAYLLNRKYVFLSQVTETKEIVKEATEFVAGRLLSGIIVIVLLPILMWIGITQTVFGVEGFVAKFLASLIGLTLNYFISKFWVFK